MQDFNKVGDGLKRLVTHQLRDLQILKTVAN
jgi:hypothetical protein